VRVRSPAQPHCLKQKIRYCCRVWVYNALTESFFILLYEMDSDEDNQLVDAYDLYMRGER